MKRFSLRTCTVIAAVLCAIMVLPTASRAESPAGIKHLIAEEASGADVPASLAMAIAKTGANFRSDHKGRSGARGVMQITPEVAESMGVSPSDLWNPRSNIRLGLEILSHLLERTEGDWPEAIAAYHSDQFKPGSPAARRNVATVLGWERRYAEQLALQAPVQDPVQSRRREVLAGHDDWRDTPPAPRDEPAEWPHESVPPHDETGWDSIDDEEEAIEIIVIERVIERPVIVHRPPPPPPHWLNDGPRGPARWRPGNRPPPRWMPRHERRLMRRMARQAARAERRRFR